MQFRLSTLLLATIVVATSLSLAGGLAGIPLAAYTLTLIAAFRGAVAKSRAAPLFLAMLITAGCCLLPPAFNRIGQPSLSRQCCNNLRQIGLALHNYADMHGAFPPLAAPGANGGPPASWRLRVLPFAESNPLYPKYRFDESWNGPNNGALIAAWPPPFYRCSVSPHVQAPGGAMTNYLAVEAPNSPWGKPPGKQPRAMVVETVGAGVGLLEPKDLPVEEAMEGINAKKQGGFASGHGGGAHVLLSDGSVRFIPDTIPPRLLRMLLTEPVDDALLDEIGALPRAADRPQWVGVRIVVWLASIAVMLLHGLPADLRSRRRRGQPT